MKLGPLEVDPPVVLAPMAGVTNAAFRTLCRSYGAGLYVSEMVSARALVEGNLTTYKRLAFGPDETVRSVQLYGVDPVVVGLAVSQVVDQGVDHIDLNMGCPSPKVTRHGGERRCPSVPDCSPLSSAQPCRPLARCRSRSRCGWVWTPTP